MTDTPSRQPDPTHDAAPGQVNPAAGTARTDYVELARRFEGSDRTLEIHQPFVHDLTGVFHAPVQAWGDAQGNIDGSGAHGVYLGDTRVADAVRLELVNGQLSPLSQRVRSAREVQFTDVVSLIDNVVDPLVTLVRTRRATGDAVSEEIRLVSHDERPRTVRLRLHLSTDQATMSQVKDYRQMLENAPERPVAQADGTRAAWEALSAHAAFTAQAPEGAAHTVTADGPRVTWEVELTAHGPHDDAAVAAWSVQMRDDTLPFGPAHGDWPASVRELTGEDADLGAPGDERAAVLALLDRSLGDLDALRLRSADGHEFLAAGAPWFFTLFGRDSLISARLALPLGEPARALALSTLTVLAVQQGQRVDVETAEQPGKILHEVRAQGMDMGESCLPPVYYGTIDATPLWIEVLHDLVEAGIGADQLEPVLPHLVAASRWLLEHADADGDGLLEYIDESGHGLANQGWKDSGDSIRWADGSLAEGTIALAEVQGYAYAAALHAADILERAMADGLVGAGGSGAGQEAAGLPGRLRAFAARLRDRFQDAFWVEDELGPYLALALDGEKRAVDGVASNMGHVLGTGILDPAQEKRVVERLLHPSMFSGFGIRTLSTTNGGYGPLRYHGGSVWTHDTAYIVRQMREASFEEEARTVARGLLRAAAGFDQRLPELFSGDSTDMVRVPAAYPASCRPQAWAAASGVVVAGVLGEA